MLKIGRPTWRETIKGWLYVLPMLLIVLVFGIYPIIASFTMSFFTEYNFFTNEVLATGWGNFMDLFLDPNFQLALKNTFIFVLGVVPLEIGLSLLIATLLNQITWLAGWFRTIYFLPFVTSVVAIAMVWRCIYNKDAGLLNHGLGWLGIQPIDWLNDPHFALLALIILAIWKGLGFNIMLLLVVLNNVDQRLYNAAKLDGAKPWQQWCYITIPMISPMTLLVTVNAVIAAFKVFDEVYALFGGQSGPANAGITLVYYLYRAFYEQNQYGQAAAAGVILFLIILLVTLIQFSISKRHVHY